MDEDGAGGTLEIARGLRETAGGRVENADSAIAPADGPAAAVPDENLAGAAFPGELSAAGDASVESVESMSGSCDGARRSVDPALEDGHTPQDSGAAIDGIREKDEAPGESGLAPSGSTAEGGFLRRLSRTGDKDRRLKILGECAEADSPLAGRLLWRSLADPCEDVRDRVVRVLAERPDFDLEAAAAVLANPPWYAKSAVLRVFALRRDPVVIPYVEKVLEDANADVRRSAVEALGEIGGRTALRLLIRMRNDGNPAVRAAVEAGIDRLSPVKFS